MSRNIHARLAYAATAMGLVLSAPALAQSAADEGNAGDIIVTAQKRAESVQDPPVSISVMGAEALETRGITNIMDLTSGAVPSLRTTPIAGLSAAANIGCPSSEHSAHVAA